MKDKRVRKKIRHFRIRKRVRGNSNIPRLVVFRSNLHIYAQIIDDQNSKTIIGVSDLNLAKEKIKTEEGKTKKSDLARLVGIAIAKKGYTQKIKKVTFDRGGYKFHGRVKALAEGAREGGLNF